MWPLAAAGFVWFLLSPTLHFDNSCKPVGCSSSTSSESESCPDQWLMGTNVTLEPSKLKLQGGFCNSIYKGDGDRAILKVFSELAMARIQVSGFSLGAIDTLVGEMGLGPRILQVAEGHTILMECLASPSLTERDVHGPNATEMLMAVAKSLAELHSLRNATTFSTNTTDTNKNMLWSSLEVLLEHIPKEDRDYYSKQVAWQHERLEALDLPTVLGHGDFKPSNVVIAKKQANFIDLETAGFHYRAFDLAKFFRTNHPTEWTPTNQEDFLKAYLQCIGDASTPPSLLQLESNVLVPMTWLEAAIFFHASRRHERWNELAQERTCQYQRSCSTFLEDIQAYQTAKASSSHGD
jgi:thiamine kinase-like enzyme